LRDVSASDDNSSSTSRRGCAGGFGNTILCLCRSLCCHPHIRHHVADMADRVEDVLLPLVRKSVPVLPFWHTGCAMDRGRSDNTAASRHRRRIYSSCPSHWYDRHA